MSNGLPGSMPSFLSFSTAGPSSADGGLSFIASASRLKNAPASMRATWSGGVVVTSTRLSTGTLAGGV